MSVWFCVKLGEEGEKITNSSLRGCGSVRNGESQGVTSRKQKPRDQAVFLLSAPVQTYSCTGLLNLTCHLASPFFQKKSKNNLFPCL